MQIKDKNGNIVIGDGCLTTAKKVQKIREIKDNLHTKMVAIQMQKAGTNLDSLLKALYIEENETTAKIMVLNQVLDILND